jgi:hypothetical protein
MCHVLQLLPMLSCVKSKSVDGEYLELYTSKLFRLTSEDTQRLAYLYRDILAIQENKPKLAHQAMLSILQIKSIMNRVRRTVELGQCMGESQEHLSILIVL